MTTEYSSKKPAVKTVAVVHCMTSRGQQRTLQYLHVRFTVMSALSLCNHLQYDVMSGLSDALLRLCAVLAGQRDGRLVQAPVLLTLQLQNKHLHWEKQALRTHRHGTTHSHQTLKILLISNTGRDPMFTLAVVNIC